MEFAATTADEYEVGGRYCEVRPNDSGFGTMSREGVIYAYMIVLPRWEDSGTGVIKEASMEHGDWSCRVPSPAPETTCSMVILRTSSLAVFQNCKSGIGLGSLPFVPASGNLASTVYRQPNHGDGKPRRLLGTVLDLSSS